MLVPLLRKTRYLDVISQLPVFHEPTDHCFREDILLSKLRQRFDQCAVLLDFPFDLELFDFFVAGKGAFNVLVEPNRFLSGVYLDADL